MNIFRASFDFDKEFLNVSSNLTIDQKSTPENPVDIFPEIKISVLKPVTDHAARNFMSNFKSSNFYFQAVLKIYYNKTSRVFMDQKLNFCSKSNSAVLFGAMIQVFKKMTKNNFKCSYSKREKLIFQKIKIRDIPLSHLFPKCLGFHETVTVKLIEDKKVEHELMKFVFEFTAVNVPKN